METRNDKERKSIKKKAEEALNEMNVKVGFIEDWVWLERQQLEGWWKGIWKELKRLTKRKSENCKLEKYKHKNTKSELHENLDQGSHTYNPI